MVTHNEKGREQRSSCCALPLQVSFRDDSSIAQDACNSLFFSYQVRGDTIHTRSVIGSSPIGATACESLKNKGSQVFLLPLHKSV